MNEEQIQGGAVLWARQTIESEIFAKPGEWFKIWFYLVCKASHKDTNKYKRGETFLQYDWICEQTGATKDQVKKCMTWLREMGMVSTRRSTRGTWIIINKYGHFQRLDNYYYNVKAPHSAPEKHQRSTREAPRYNKNEKNEKNEKNIAEQSSALVITNLLKDNKKHIQIIGLYAKAKKVEFENKEQQQSFIKRNLRASNDLVGYNFQRIVDTMNYLMVNADFKWTLESVAKYIDEDTNKLKSNQSEEDEIKSFFDKY